MLADGVERLLETQARLRVDLVDELFELGLGFGEIRELRREKLLALFQLVLLGDRVV